ncbi:hypothetical protein [Paenibacillus kyungheensis]
MAKIEEAYSIECREIIDVEKAYELYWDNIIYNKQAFKCPGCTMQITAANIDKQRNEMKNTPHFRAYGDHDFKCKYEFEKRKQNQIKSNKNRKQLKIDKQIDSLFLERPINHQYVNNGVKINSKSTQSNKEIFIEKNQKNQNYQKKPSNYYSIKPLVSKFIKYENEERLEENFINIKGNNISYKDMFIDFTDINLNNICNYKRIYYGEGKVVKSNKKNEDYIIFFNPGITNAGNKKTSLYISKEFIKNNRNYNKWIVLLNELVREKKRVNFFAYCKISIKDNYINLTHLSNLDFFECMDI